jgi:hypothetical protein
MQDKWEPVLRSLQPLLRACGDGDPSMRWIIMDVLPTLVHECIEIAEANDPQPFLMRLYELMFVLCLIKADAIASLGNDTNVLQSRCPKTMEVLQELDAATSAATNTLASLLDIPKSEPKRPILCVMKDFAPAFL